MALYTMFFDKIKYKNADVKKSFMMLWRVMKNLRLYLFYRIAGPAFQAVMAFWK